MSGDSESYETTKRNKLLKRLDSLKIEEEILIKRINNIDITDENKGVSTESRNRHIRMKRSLQGRPSIYYKQDLNSED